MLHRSSILLQQVRLISLPVACSSFLSGPSWSVSSFESTEESSISYEDIQQCGMLSNLTKDVSRTTIKDVQKIINCSKTIAEVDVSLEKFKRTPLEIEQNTVYGMISPFEQKLRCRDTKDKTGRQDFAEPLTLSALKVNAKQYKQMENQFFSVPKISSQEVE